MTREERQKFLQIAENELVNLVRSENYSPAMKLQCIDDLVNSYKRQLERAVKEGY